MNNYQLHRTNVLLGGQLTWNLYINSKGSDLYINDFSLSPISNNIVYSRPDYDITNYNHNENIKGLYDKIRANFYESCLDPKFLSKTPTIIEDETLLDTYCSDYDSGIRRSYVYRTGKSMQLLCPIWLEDFGVNDELIFNIEAYTEIDGEKTISTTKSLSLCKNNIEFHDKFINYFSNYIKSISRDNKIGDELINIDFDNRIITVEGVDVKSGSLKTRDISNKLFSLIEIFRPMIDTDDIIINCLKTNELIAKQLFNFSFLFDIEDFLSPTLLKEIKGSKIKFDISTYIKHGDDLQKLEIKSFDYNYSNTLNNNALRVLNDYNSIDLIDKNKILPNIIHWSLAIDNNYIFNLYPEYYTNTNIYNVEHDFDINSIHWCNNNILLNKKLDTSKPTLEYLDYSIPFADYTKFDGSDCIVNNIHYEKSNNSNNIPLYLYIAILDNNIEQNDENLKELESGIYLYKREYIENTLLRCILIVNKNNMNLVSYNYIKENLLTSIDNIINEFGISNVVKLNDMFTNIIPSKIIPFNQTVIPFITKSPTNKSTDITEISYKKKFISEQYLFRYDGKIKPTFINIDECKYWQMKKIKKDDYKKDWDSLVKTKYPALYPSINYFYLEEIKNNEFLLEHRWFFDSDIYALNKNIDWIIERDLIDNTPNISIYDDIKSLLKSYYNINDDIVVEYIYNLYNIEINFDYNTIIENDQIIYKYTYFIKLTLK